MIKIDAEKNGFELFKSMEEFLIFYPTNCEPEPLNYPEKFPCLAYEGQAFYDDRDIMKYPMCYVYEFEIV